MPQVPGAGSEEQCQEEAPREIHIWEFPPHFYVRLEPKVTRDLVNQAVKRVGGIKQLARVFKVSAVSVRNYRSCRTFIPIQTLLNLCKIAGDAFAIEQVEPYIVAYKGGPVGNPIQNPHLPLVETPDLFALMGHLAGDGGYGKYSAYYFNTHEALISEFLRLLRSVFGDVPVHLVTRNSKKSEKGVTKVSFGLTIVRLLQHLYQVDFRTFTARVPQRLRKLPRKFSVAFLRAYGDDEGTVHDCWIGLFSANLELMQDIYDLVLEKFPEFIDFLSVRTIEKEKEGYSNMHILKFRSGALESYGTFIGFTHQEKKQALEITLARRKRGWRRRNSGTTRRMLLKLLQSGPMTAKDLGRALEVTDGAIHQHLKNLISLGVVIQTTTVGQGGAQVFALTETGHKSLELPSILLERRGGIIREILKTLALARKGLTMTELIHQLGLNKYTIRNHVSRKARLIELGLIKRSGRGTRTVPTSIA